MILRSAVSICIRQSADLSGTLEDMVHVGSDAPGNFETPRTVDKSTASP